VSTLVIPWLVFPVVLAGLSLGCGLLLERFSGLRLPGTLVLPTGFALLAVGAQLATATSATARLAVPLVVVLAVAGFALSYPWRGRRADGWPVGAAIAVFGAYAAPIVLSGRATWAGYIKLDDNSTLLALVDRAMDHGPTISGVAPSTYWRVLDGLLIHGYPLATFMPLGIGHRLLGTDAAFLYQPCLAFMAAMLALSLYELTKRLIDPSWARALIAFVAAQAALLYGYALWGGIKELGTAWAVPLLAALVPVTARAKGYRSLIPLAVATALLLGVLSVGAAVWVAPALVLALVAVFHERGSGEALRAIAAFAGFVAVLALPTIVTARAFLTSNITSYDPVANLGHALNPLQVAGIWPAGDFRADAHPLAPTYLLAAVALAAAAGGAFWAIRRGVWELAVFVVGAVASAFFLHWTNTPWIAAKAFATASPAVPLAALVLCVLLYRHGRPAEGLVLAVVVVGGVLWSNVLQYHGAWLAPRSQMAELASIGGRFAGDGPALQTEYSPYGARHFLRRLDAESASELRVRPVALRNGQLLPQGASADIDDFSLDAILVYRTLVLRRSPVASRPPSLYRLVSKGSWYEVWQRPESGGPRILEHLSLGTDADPGAVSSCAQVLRLARLPGVTRLAAVERPAVTRADLSQAAFPSGWTEQEGALVPAGAGTVQVDARLRSRGRYGIWLGGSFRDRLETLVDGRKLETMRDQLNWSGVYTPLGEVTLGPGVHRITLRYGGPDLRPGSGGAQFPMGPLVLGRTTAELPVRYVRPSEARSLCGKRLDWVETLGA
jgi:hypothetical protein